MHLDAAVSQRRIWGNFIRDYVNRVDPNLKLPEDALPVFLCEDEPVYSDDKHDSAIPSEVDLNQSQRYTFSDSKEASPALDNLIDCIAGVNVDNVKRGIQLQAEDYGGSLALPHYGFQRPSVDYFNSNLMAYNYVVADVSAGKNHVYYYDERHQGKGADALCSLRMRYHLKKVRQFYDEGLSPVLSMSLLDNCVGQNKSQVVMKFFCMLSVLFYDTVALLYFLPGHSHMIPDRIVAHCKLAIKGLNLYTLGQIADHCSRIKNLQAE